MRLLLYDLTSTYFESDPPFGEEDKRKFGHSRDKRSDCVQVVVGLVVTPEGFPLADEVMAGNSRDKKTLGDFLAKIEQQYGRADRIWVMDRGIPTEQVRRREGHYLLRSNLWGENPEKLWEVYVRLTQVEEAFKNLKGDLAVRPIYQQKEQRIEFTLRLHHTAAMLRTGCSPPVAPHGHITAPQLPSVTGR